VLTFNDGILFRTKTFTPDYRYTLNFVDAWSVDEIVVLDVTRPTGSGRMAFRDVVSHFSRNCFVPLSAGGGVRNLDDVKELLAIGADKIVVNTGAIERPELIGEIADRYGSQCVVLSIDAKRLADGRYEVYSSFGAKPTGLSPVDWAKRGEASGAGEILITSIDRDGSLQGYDVELGRQVADAVSLPVLICGGAGNWQHFVDGFNQGHASAVCTANIYHFTEASIRSAKKFLAQAGIPVRIEQAAS
jgi:cyclase